MRVLIVGAGSLLGQALVREATKQDHTVSEFAQDLVLKPGSFDSPLLDQEAVICCLDHERTRDAVTALSEGTENLIRAMQRHNVRRLLCVTGVGAGDSVGHGGFLFNRIMQPLFWKTVFEDKTRQEKLIRACDRDWTIVRPARLMPGRARARFSVVQNTRGLQAGAISRADVAVWTVAQLEIEKYLYRAVALTE